MNVKQESVLRFVKQVYCPVSKEAQMHALVAYILKHPLRNVEPQDAHTTNVPMLKINIDGKGCRAVFKGFEIVRADFNNVSEVYAEAYIKYEDETKNHPQRVFTKSTRYVIIEKG